MRAITNLRELTEDVDTVVEYMVGKEFRDYVEQIVEGNIDPWDGDSGRHIYTVIERLYAFVRQPQETRERARDILREMGWPELAADVEDGLPVSQILARLREIGEAESAAYYLIETMPDE